VCPRHLLLLLFYNPKSHIKIHYLVNCLESKQKLKFKTFSELVGYVNLVLWQHVVILCVSRAVFRVSLVMVVRRMLCSVRLVMVVRRMFCSVRLTHNTRHAATAPELKQRSNSLNILNYNFSKE
jgi:hypothetical protein